MVFENKEVLLKVGKKHERVYPDLKYDYLFCKCASCQAVYKSGLHENRSNSFCDVSQRRSAFPDFDIMVKVLRTL